MIAIRAASILLALLIGLSVTYAQTDSDRLLTTSIDSNTGSVSLVTVDLANSNHNTVTTFNDISFCMPQIISDGTQALYEPVTQEESPVIYRVNLADGIITLAEDLAGLRCPVVNSVSNQIAWLMDTPNGTQLLISDGDNRTPIATHDTILDAMWSPDGTRLVYTRTESDSVFRPVMLFTNNENRDIWNRDAGLVVDYAWLPDSTTLVVIYYTETGLEIGKLDEACFVEGECAPQSLATFGDDSTLILTDAIADDAVVMIQEQSSGMGQLSADLLQLNPQDGTVTTLTETPDIIETSAYFWQDDLIFVGTSYDPTTFTVLSSALYDADGNVFYQAEGYTPLQIIGQVR